MSDHNDDIGTVRWFGDGWGAPVNDPRARVPVPAGESCGGPCGQLIAEHDRGIGIPHSPDGHYGWYHLNCWMRSLGLMVHANQGLEIGPPEARHGT